MERSEEWFDFFPTEERFGKTYPSTTVLVDMGGGLVHDIAFFQKRFPSLSGKLVLQDLSPVISAITELNPAIERSIHNLFEPQPIKGAKAYYLRQVLHDFPDKEAIAILKNTRDAMSADSVLLLNENFLPETDVPLFNAEINFSMLACLAAMERTEKEWTELLKAAGLKLVKVWTPK